MPYQRNIPLATDALSQSQGDIEGNFQSIYDAWIVNHVVFDNADQGKHKWVEFALQPNVPNFLAGNQEIFNLLLNGQTNPVDPAIIIHHYPNTGTNELWVKRADAAALNTNPTPFTASVKISGAGYTYLPSGIIIEWGFANTTVSNPLIFDVPHYNAGNVTFPELTTSMARYVVANGTAGDANLVATLLPNAGVYNPHRFTVQTSAITTGLPKIGSFWYLLLGI